MRVLIAEDDGALRSLIAATVPAHWEVHEATDGVETVAAARRLQPDAIILDHQMPVITGVEVCRLLAAEPWRGSCRVVALTGVRDAEIRRQMAAAGADAFLEKPFSPIELIELVSVWERRA
ncbi:MAG: response regulator [Actinobacteria bacterium]|nr:response regulator [Actinomycetota bacterium]